MRKDKFIPYGRQYISNSDINTVKKSLTKSLITTGSFVKSFEKKLKLHLNSKYVLTCNSGTSAIYLAYLSMGLKKGDNVIIPAINFVASANMAKLIGANIYLADVDNATGQLTEKTIIDCINKNKLKKIKLLVTMFLGGNPHEVEKYYILKKKYNFLILEDACHALGAKYKVNKKFYKVGSCKHSDISIFSLHPLKSITTGEGGVISTNNKFFFENCKLLRSHGMLKNSQYYNYKYDIIKTGFNFRLSDINCALGISQLKSLKKFIKKRDQIAKIYNKLFKNLNSIEISHNQNLKNISSWHLYIIKIDFNKLKVSRNNLIKFLYENKILTQIHYIPIFMFKNFKKTSKGKFPNALEYYNCCLSLPIYYDLKKKDQIFIFNKIIKYLYQKK